MAVIWEERCSVINSVSDQSEVAFAAGVALQYETHFNCKVLHLIWTEDGKLLSTAADSKGTSAIPSDFPNKCHSNCVQNDSLLSTVLLILLSGS